MIAYHKPHVHKTIDTIYILVEGNIESHYIDEIFVASITD